MLPHERAMRDNCDNIVACCIVYTTIMGSSVQTLAAASNLLKCTLQLALKRRLSRKSPMATASTPQLPFFVVSSSAHKPLAANKCSNPRGKDVGVGSRSCSRAANLDGQSTGSATPLHAMARCLDKVWYSVCARE